MSDTFGLLEIPIPPPTGGGSVSDPALDIILSFMKAVINADCGEAWKAVAKSDPLPVQYTFAEDVQLENLNENETPALYAWRGNDKGSERYSQDIIGDDGGIHCLWVPPPCEPEQRRVRQPFRNGIKKALRAAFGKGRHPAWVLEGDTYFNPARYGSVLLHHTRCSKLTLGEFRPHELTVETGSAGHKYTLDCLFFVIANLEMHTVDPIRAGAAVQTRLDGSFRLGPEADLIVQEYQLNLTVNEANPPTGSVAGGTIVTLDGAQFVDGMTVHFGDKAGTQVTYVDESTITVRTPSMTVPGVVDVTVRTPSDEAILSNGFTFT